MFLLLLLLLLLLVNSVYAMCHVNPICIPVMFFYLFVYSFKVDYFEVFSGIL